MQLFFPTAPGVEPFLVEEIRRMRPQLEPQAVLGGVELEAPASQVPCLCWGLRCALGVWWRIASFPARHFGQLQKGLRAVNLEAALGQRTHVELKVSSKRSRLYHDKAIAQRFFEATGCSPAEANTQAPRLHLRLFRDKATLSVDLVGGLLTKRGWRKETAKAPLRKDLAALVLRASGWHPGQPLLDPLCGSGTLVIEAARACAGAWPNGLRAFDFPQFPPWHQAELQAVAARGKMPAEHCGDWPAAASSLIGMDRNAGALAIAQRNAQRAQVEGIDWRQLELASTTRWSLPEGTFVVCNPPFGERVGHRGAMRALFAQLGEKVRQVGAAARFACIAPRGPWIEAMGLDLAPVVATDFGGLSVTIYVGSNTAKLVGATADKADTPHAQ